MTSMKNVFIITERNPGVGHWASLDILRFLKKCYDSHGHDERILKYITLIQASPGPLTLKDDNEAIGLANIIRDCIEMHEPQEARYHSSGRQMTSILTRLKELENSISKRSLSRNDRSNYYGK